MKRRVFLKGCAASLAGFARPSVLSSNACAALPAGMPDTSGMNVLLILVEGLAANAVGCYGNSQVWTPNLDRFATRAMRFTRCYCQTPMSDLSRHSLFTSLRPAPTDVAPDASLAGARSLPEVLRQYGFRDVKMGKPCGGAQRRNSSDHAKGCHDACEHRSAAERKAKEGSKNRRVTEILAESAEAGSPFFISVDFSSLHMPLRCPATFLDLYDPSRIPYPQAPTCRDRDIPAVARRFGRNDIVLRRDDDGPMSEEDARQTVLAYYACVSFIDAQIGAVLDALDRAPQCGDTIVGILSNHGFHLGEHGLWGAQTLFEQSTRVPLLIRVPGVTTRQAVCDEIVELVDLLPTVCDLLAVPVPDRTEGRSFAPLLHDPLQPWKRAAFTVCAMDDHIGRSVRTKRWRYADWQSCTTSLRQFELYDLDTDPWEQVNLALHPDYRNERTILANLLQRGWKAAQ